MCPYIYIFGYPIASYGLCMMVGLCLAGFLSYRAGKPGGMRPEDMLIIGVSTLLCALAGGGLLYIFVTYTPAELWNMLRSGDFSFIGGIVFYGGLIGGIAGGLLGIRLTKCPIGLATRSIIPFVPLGHAVGRIGCVMAGCCYGFEYDGPLALHYPNSLSGLDPEQGYFPVQLLEGALNVGICILLLKLRKKLRGNWSILFTYLGMYAVTRFCLEFLRGDTIRGRWGGLSTSQWVSLGLLAVSGSYFLTGYLKRQKKATA